MKALLWCLIKKNLKWRKLACQLKWHGDVAMINEFSLLAAYNIQQYIINIYIQFYFILK